MAPLPLNQIDLTGARFGRLTCLKFIPGKWKAGKRLHPPLWQCCCDCGTLTNVSVYQLLNGMIQSCGCLRLERLRAAITTHGKTKTPEYKILMNAKQRCTNHALPDWKNYGGRGVEVDPALTVETLLADIGPRPSPSHSLDRIDNSKGYQVGNLRWATRREQNLNSRHNRRLTLQGKTLTVSEWAVELGMPYTALATRVQRGWSESEVLTTPYPAKSGPKPKKLTAP